MNKQVLGFAGLVVTAVASTVFTTMMNDNSMKKYVKKEFDKKYVECNEQEVE